MKIINDTKKSKYESEISTQDSSSKHANETSILNPEKSSSKWFDLSKTFKKTDIQQALLAEPEYKIGGLYQVSTPTIDTTKVDQTSLRGDISIANNNRVIFNRREHKINNSTQITDAKLYQFTPKPDGKCFYFPYVHLTTVFSKDDNIFNGADGLGYVIINKKDIIPGTVVYTKGLNGCAIHVIEQGENLIFVHDANSKAFKQYIANNPEHFAGQNFKTLDMIDFEESYDALIPLAQSEDKNNNDLFVRNSARITKSCILQNLPPATPATDIYFVYDEKKQGFVKVSCTYFYTENTQQGFFKNDTWEIIESYTHKADDIIQFEHLS
jgi:hypothetical protein